MKRTFITAATLLVGIITLHSCKKNDPTILQSWVNYPLSTQFENPAPAGRNETGTFTLELYSDNTVKWSASVNNLLAGDPIISGHIHAGDAVTNGPIILNLNPVFYAGQASGTINVTSSLADSLQMIPIYANFHSTAVPSGLIRTQLDKKIDVAYQVPMNGLSEVPAVATSATGLAFLRLMTDKTLYYKVTVNSVDPGDQLTVSHIHRGAAGTAGAVFINLIVPADPAAFGQPKNVLLNDAQILELKNDPVYVNAHSVLRPAGLVRGQIR